MKKLLYCLLGTFFLTSWSFGQSLQVGKAVGQTATIKWAFPTTSEAQITGFQVQSGQSTSGPWTNVISVGASSRQTVVTVQGPGYYQVLSYLDPTGGARQFSMPSNPVAVNIVLPAPGLSTIQ